MSPKPPKEPLERTSIQLPRQTIEVLDSWPSLNRSEALRLTVERYHYLESIAGPQAEKVVNDYRPVFEVALAELTFSDYKIVARSLPALVMAAMAEEGLRESVEHQRRGELIPWKQLKVDMEALDTVARIYLLDYVVLERLREEERAGG